MQSSQPRRRRLAENQCRFPKDGHFDASTRCDFSCTQRRSAIVLPRCVVFGGVPVRLDDKRESLGDDRYNEKQSNSQYTSNNAKDGFTIPGVGKVSVRQTKARKMVMRFGPNEGKELDVPAKTKLKFTFLKAAKEEILG